MVSTFLYNPTTITEPTIVQAANLMSVQAVFAMVSEVSRSDTP